MAFCWEYIVNISVHNTFFKKEYFLKINSPNSNYFKFQLDQSIGMHVCVFEGNICILKAFNNTAF